MWQCLCTSASATKSECGMSQTSSRCTQQMLSQHPDAGFQFASDAVQTAHLRDCLEAGFEGFGLSQCIEIPPTGEVRRDFACIWRTRGVKGPGHLPAQASGEQPNGHIQFWSQAVRQQASLRSTCPHSACLFAHSARGAFWVANL